MNPWTVVENEWDPHRANYFETLFTVGNGRLGTRGSLEERHTGSLPGTFLAGVYDAFDAPVVDLVNAPDWLVTEVFADGTRLDTESATVLGHRRELDLRRGVLARETKFALPDGARFVLRTERFASMADRDLCCLRVRVTALDRTASVTIRSGIDGHRRNLERLPAYPEGTEFGYDRKWDKWALSTHLRSTGTGFVDGVGTLECRTIDSGIDLAYALRVELSGIPERRVEQRGHESITVESEFALAPGETVGVDKFVGIATSRDPKAGAAPADRARATVARVADLKQASAANAAAWQRLWSASDCEVVGDDRVAQALRFAVYHLLIAADPDDPTVSIGAKSLSGEGYRGHVFWDTEVMLLPFYLFTQPRAARALLGYRHHTLPGAREVAADNGAPGARFPWESADTGREECPQYTSDGSGRFYTREEELHVTADVAYAVMRYAEVTGDDAYLFTEGAPILFDTARYWVRRCEPEGAALVLRTVMGPDEFHSHVDNNAYTNRLVRWHLEQAAAVHHRMATEQPELLAAHSESLALSATEAEQWLDAARRLRVPVDPDCGLIEQFDGYFDRTVVPITEWDDNGMPRFPAGRDHLTCEDTSLVKQPDVVMLLHLLPEEYSLDTRRQNYAFYEARTLHKSSLSPSIHAIVGLQVGEADAAERYFARSAFVDLDDNQGNTEDGIHIAAAAGTWQAATHGFGGFQATRAGLRFSPVLPSSWERLRFSVCWRGRRVRVDLGHQDARFELIGDGPAETITVWGDPVRVPPNEIVEVRAPQSVVS
ncbi:glycoside hydrolase family 65 protein [Nocardia caishijiensis]|uniref:Kojibiose phosphorylase n=1 Tax=Nocardia caishijiensis TaxID=184756 RepID=A0ABQ6YI07_9NOCA|nr:glycosyl hydrolase family 65 protein [Nocardia caishijiensis]KAF0845394.1 kojibiose phosphorylase [Nocardia caishijiensis]